MHNIYTVSCSEISQSASRQRPIWLNSYACDDDNDLSDCTLFAPMGYGNCIDGGLLLVHCGK